MGSSNYWGFQIPAEEFVSGQTSVFEFFYLLAWGFLRICLIYSFCSSYSKNLFLCTLDSFSAQTFGVRVLRICLICLTDFAIVLFKFVDYRNYSLCTSTLCRALFRAPCGRTPLIPIFIFNIPLKNGIPTTATTPWTALWNLCSAMQCPSWYPLC